MMARRKEIIGDATLYLGDCLEVMAGMDSKSVDAVVTDPPYMGVIKEPWDNQWDDDAHFLRYVSNILNEFNRLLVDSGSLYFFASPSMAARVEVEIRKYFNVLNNIIWSKGASRKGAAGSGIDVTSLRRFWSSSTERIIFAEKYSSDSDYQGALVAGGATYWGACEGAKVKVIGDYLKKEIARASSSNRAIAMLFPSKTGGLTGCVSNWITGANFPTKEQYEKMRNYLNKSGDEYLRREYEELRREYEELRRPFNLNASMQWGDVWEFGLPTSRNGHPCEKPESLMSHIITISARVGSAILDPFMGSGTTGVACSELGRKFIGIEINEEYFDIACKRIEAAHKQLKLFV